MSLILKQYYICKNDINMWIFYYWGLGIILLLNSLEGVLCITYEMFLNVKNIPLEKSNFIA